MLLQLSIKMQAAPRFDAPISCTKAGALERQRTLRSLFSQRVKSTPMKYRADQLFRMPTGQFIGFLHASGRQPVCDQAVQTQRL